MTSFLLWLVAVELLGLAALPLALALLPRLPDRGYGLSKVLGILLVTYLNYLFGSLFGAGNNVALLALGMIVLFVVGLVLLRDERGAPLAVWLRANRRAIGVEEAIFLLGFVAWTLFRVAHPGILSTEKPMDLALMTAAHKATSFPPYDPWLAGTTINYYYGGYLAVGTLVTLTGVAPAIGFNLAVALLFGLVGTAAYSIVYGLTRSVRWALLGPAFILLCGNLDGLMQLFDPSRGTAAFNFFQSSRVVEPTQCNGSCTITEFPAFSFLLADLHPHVIALPFTILAIGVALNLALAPVAGWAGLAADNARRVLVVVLAGLASGALYFFNSWDWPTYTLLIGAALLVPALSARVLAQRGAALTGTAGFQPAPTVAATGGRHEVGAPRGATGDGRDARAPSETGRAVHASQQNWRPLYEGIGLAVAVLALSYLLYISFRLHFVPQYDTFGLRAHGSPTGQVLIMFGLFLLPVAAFIITRFARGEGVALAASAPVPRPAVALATAQATLGAGRTAVLERGPATSAAPGRRGAGAGKMPAAPANDSYDGSPADDGDDVLPHLPTLSLPRLTALGGMDRALALLAVAAVLLALFKVAGNLGTFGLLLPFALVALYLAWREARAERPANAFALLLCAGGIALIMLCDVVFLKDNFCNPDASGACTNSLYRMNTVFKFYYQAWTVLALGGAYGLYSLAGLLRAGWRRFVAPGASVVLAAAGITYLLLGMFTPASVNAYFPPDTGAATLDGSAFLSNYSGPPAAIAKAIPSDAAAIRWLNAHVGGHPTILEADWVHTPPYPPGPQDYWPYPGNSNQELMMSRISTFTGLPAVLGWGYSHEGLWHSDAVVAQRFTDVTTMYTSTNFATVGALLRRYHVSLIYVGKIEAYSYYGDNPARVSAAIDRFKHFGTVVYNAGGVTIIRSKT